MEGPEGWGGRTSKSKRAIGARQRLWAHVVFPFSFVKKNHPCFLIRPSLKIAALQLTKLGASTRGHCGDCSPFSRMRSEVFPFTVWGVWGLDPSRRRRVVAVLQGPNYTVGKRRTREFNDLYVLFAVFVGLVRES